ncbi:hypothetical protein K501DRAFT_203150, partial [Backusella circina FSU 941]
RLKEKLKRNPSEKVDTSKWPRPKTPQQVLHHAIKGGLRSFILAYGVRATVNFLLYLIRVFRGKAPLSNILAASFKNLDSIRFGAMFGSFALLWKGVNNGMRLYRGKDDRLNGLVSGAVAGLSILFEKKERRVDIAQQLFAVYNAGKARDIFYFKNGDALLFAVTCGQVLYAYTMRPDSLPPDFYNFMVKAARVREGSLLLNAKNVRGSPVTAEEALSVISKFNPTKHAINVVSQIPSDTSVLPCETLHPWMDGCHATAFERFVKVFKSFLPVYGTLHFAPMLVLRYKHLMKDPATMLSKTTIATMKSGAFLATFVTLYQYQICTHRNMFKAGLIGNWNSKYLYWLAGFFCSYPAIFFEDKKRRGPHQRLELAYALNQS